jgi:antitoxin ParD1/3/4
MRIAISPEQEAWLKSHFAISDEATLEAAARRLLDERMEEWETDDLAWAKPLVDEGIAALERGDAISLEEHRARIAARLAAMKR